MVKYSIIIYLAEFVLNNVLIYFNLMLSCRCSQIFSDCIKGGIDKPFAKCLHNELSRDIPADVVLKSNVPSEVL